MNYFLVDFENVRSDGVKKYVKVEKRDEVVIFFSDQCKNIALDTIELITSKGAIISCHKAKTGTKNALDFQLSSHLGYLIGWEDSRGDKANYYIVSNDKGYDCLIEHWKEKGKAVERIGEDNPMPSTERQNNEIKEKELADNIKSYIFL